jgi:hypothetical protein
MYPSEFSGERNDGDSAQLSACSSWDEGASSRPPESAAALDASDLRTCSEFPERMLHSVMPMESSLVSFVATPAPIGESLLEAPQLPRPPATPRLHSLLQQTHRSQSLPDPGPLSSPAPSERPAAPLSNILLALLAVGSGFGGGLLLARLFGLI